VTDPVLELTDVSKDYHGLRPLRIANLSVHRGEQVALVGFDQPSAEVFVNLVTGATLPDRGTVCLLGRATALDLFRGLPETGNFVLVNAIDGATVAGGVITWAQAGAPAVGDNVLVLNRALLARGLCADLGDSPADEAEFNRRAQEVALLLRSAGVPVLVEL